MPSQGHLPPSFWISGYNILRNSEANVERNFERKKLFFIFFQNGNTENLRHMNKFTATGQVFGQLWLPAVSNIAAAGDQCSSDC